MQKLNITAILCGLLLSALSARLQAQPAGPSLVLRIACEGEALDAEVHVNGTFKGQCPVDVPVPEGPVQVRVTKAAGVLNERVFEQALRMAAGTAKRLDVVLGAPQLNARGLQLKAEQEAAARRQAEAAAAREAEARAQVERELQDLQQQAAAGDVQAMLALARRHDHGKGVPRNPAQAHAWTAKAAATRDGEALYRLGRQQSHGFGTPKDLVAALAFFRQAAQVGHANAMGHIALAYLEGKGVGADRALAESWAMRGMQGSDGVAPMVLFYMAYTASDADMSSRGKKALHLAARHGNRTALFVCASHGLGGDARNVARFGPCPSDLGDPVAMYKLAARAGDDGEAPPDIVFLQLGHVHMQGLAGQPKDAAEAAKWYQLSAEAGSPERMFHMAYFTAEGLGGLRKDPAKALVLYQGAAELRHATSMRLVGRSYVDGYMGQRIDRKTGIAWIRKAMAAGEEKSGKELLKRLDVGWFE